MRQSSEAAARNREPIREVLVDQLPSSGLVLEIASGTGMHAVHFASQFPALTWQPSDVDPVALASIAAWRDDAALANLRAPIALDVTRPWPVASADAVLAINLVHISPFEVTGALFAGAATVLPQAGLLYLYGPYRFDGITAPSNDAFDRSLRARDPRWGVRDIRDIAEVAARTGFAHVDTVAMPANNHSLIFRRRVS
jgi:hypothetical protein